jgi:hypothetical protein
MITDRLIDLSLYYFVENVFIGSPFIKIREGFPEDLLTVPCIAIELDEIATYPSELGNRIRGRIRTWYIDIFAADKAQRDEYAYRLMGALESDVPVYNYDEGFPPSSTPSRIGCLKTDDIKMQIIKVLPELTEKMYYRSVIIFTGEYYPS